MTEVRRHTRFVDGKRQTVRRHRRGSVPAFARANLVKAWRSGKRKQYTPAAIYATAGVGTYAAWGLFQAGTAALTTVGMAGLIAGYAIHRRRQRNRGNLPTRTNRSARSGQAGRTTDWSRPPVLNPDGSTTVFHKDGSMDRINPDGSTRQVLVRRPNR